MIKKRLFALVLMGLMLFVMGCDFFGLFANDDEIEDSISGNDITELVANVGGGDSSLPDTTFVVNSSEDYKEVMGLTGYNITINLKKDLDFGGETLPPLINIVAFIGNNHTISNFSIIGVSQYVGLLYSVSDSVCDLTLRIKDIGNANNSNFGALVGHLLPTAKMRNCHVIGNTNNSGTLPTVSGKDYVGGLVGYSEGIIDRCSVSGINVSGASHIGGMVGSSNTSATITNCVVHSMKVSATGSFVGGLIGFNRATIDSCSAAFMKVTTSVFGDSYVGGLVGQNHDNDVKNSKVTNSMITGYKFLGGLVGHTLSGSLSNDIVSDVLVVATNDQAGGLTSYLAPNCTAKYCNVNDINIFGKEKIAGLIGLSDGSIISCKVESSTVEGTTDIGGMVGLSAAGQNITECKVASVTVNGTNILGGLVGSNSRATISQCCVDSVTVAATSNRVGGLVGYNLGNISNCSVSRATLSSPTYLGGIVGENRGATVLRCLATGTTITSSNTDANSGFIGGVVGYNFGGWVKNCVAMIKYFDIKAKYTKDGQRFGRIVSNNGNLSQNYGWVETTIKYWHWRFGINWGTDYYRGTGQTFQNYRNGENLLIGDKHTGGFAMAKESSFWTGIGFTSDNGWSTIDVGTNYYPKLTFVQSENLGSIGDARGFEYEAKLITDNNGDYQGKTVNIFTPQFFSRYVAGGYCAYLGNSFCNLYTDIELDTENGRGNSVFWSTDLNRDLPYNFTYSAIRLHDNKSLTFDGQGHSIINLFKKHENSYDANGQYSGGFFHAPISDLTIKRLELEDPKVYMYAYGIDEAYVRYGFLVCQSSWTVNLEDIYVKNPVMEITSQYPPRNEAIAFRDGYNGFVGTMIGKASVVNGERLVVYMPETSSIRTIFAHIGCLFGFVYNSIDLKGVAVYLSNSGYDRQLSTWTNRLGKILRPAFESVQQDDFSQFFSMGYICAVGTGPGMENDDNDYTTGSKNFENISLHDGHEGSIGWIDWTHYFPSKTFMAPLPFIFQLGYTFDGRDCGGDYPKAGSFANTLDNIGISSSSNWIYDSNNPTDLKLKRDEYTGNYIN